MTDEQKVLVAYASRHGSTTGIAQRIADGLASAGAQVDLRPVGDAGDPAAYDAVVLGSPVYDGRWPPEASAYVQANTAALADRPLWLFSVGAFGDTHRLIGSMVTREPRDIGPLRDSLRPRAYRVFAGAVEREQWPWYGRLLYRAFGGRFGDSRDWGAIEAFAGGIADELAGGAPARAPGAAG
jgi:menaquinone-dependent protoporphyrinogen oxidase